MARLAFDRHVRAKQRKRCLRIVIEKPGRPVDRVVAQTARVAEPALVPVVIAMAIDTSHRGVPEHLRCMTCNALLAAVSAQQREPGQVVIEEQVVGPAELVVAVIARLALGTLVRIVRSMAAVAPGTQ